ncbi:hypothetical protein GCM10011289_07100 [Paludibacterium paludis]|uniref:Phage protein D n=2 Tax=Paludibacterium paludis TaxID=1225769 RepID=A0A918U801_9NEIS|nr:hypothetical protein GCM10011289_07100 [Paludibacterium paludis]
MTGWIAMEVDNNAFLSADTFRVVFARASLPEGYDIDWFSRQTVFRVEVQFDDGTGLRSFALGNADTLVYDPVAGTLTLEGRDLTSLLADTKISRKWQNLTASQIAAEIARAHDLTPRVAETRTRAGSYYQIDHVQLQDEMSEWDLLTYLARREEFACFVSGRELHFAPMPAPGGADVYRIDWSDAQSGPVCAVRTLAFERALSVSRGIEVSVSSFNVKQKNGFTVTHPEPKGKKDGAGGGASQYRFTYPNLTRDAARRKAVALYDEIARHEMKLEATLPGDNLLMPDVLIEVAGTASDFDQTYYVDSIRRSLDVEGGYLMSVSAKNRNPATEGGQA